ncbi:MAG: hypothetical protein QXI12_02450 [Candidatus Methanomethyliaceae archaeon]
MGAENKIKLRVKNEKRKTKNKNKNKTCVEDNAVPPCRLSGELFPPAAVGVAVLPEHALLALAVAGGRVLVDEYPSPPLAYRALGVEWFHLRRAYPHLPGPVAPEAFPCRRDEVEDVPPIPARPIILAEHDSPAPHPEICAGIF